MMKKYILVVVLFLNYFVLFSQKIEEEEIAGMWKVAKSITNKTNANFKDIVEGFEASTFNFEPNGSFKITSPNKSKIFKTTTDMISNQKWRFNSNQQRLQIGSEKDYYSIMEINVKRVEDKIIFQITDTIMEFEMIKVNKE